MQIAGACTAENDQYCLKSYKVKTNLQYSFYPRDQWTSQGEGNGYCSAQKLRKKCIYFVQNKYIYNKTIFIYSLIYKKKFQLKANNSFKI